MDIEAAQRMAGRQSGMLEELNEARRMRASVTDYLAGPAGHKELARLCMDYGEAAVLREIDNREK